MRTLFETCGCCPMKPQRKALKLGAVVWNAILVSLLPLTDPCDAGSYEAPSWGIAFQRWQDIDRVIRKIDRPNVQQCIDTYHIGSFEWGDPESPQTGFKRPDGDERLDSSLSELKASLASGDIGYFQVRMLRKRPIHLAGRGRHAHPGSLQTFSCQTPVLWI